MSQKKYLKKLLEKVSLQEAKSMPTPMVTSHLLSSTTGCNSFDPKLYRSTVGALQYFTIRCSDISYSVNKICHNKVSQYMQKSLDTHWKAVKHLLLYLKGIQEFGLV